MGDFSSFISGLEFLTDSPSEYQQYIYQKWNQSYFGSNTNNGYSEHEVTQKKLKYIFPYLFLVKSPFDLPGLIDAISIVQTFFHNKHGKKLLIYGDRDADGVCSSSILFLYLRDKMDIPENNVKVLLPEEEDKYGITQAVADKILLNQPDILITLDNGSSNKETFDYIKKVNPEIKIIIIDHHSIPDDKNNYPAVDSFINPFMLPQNDSRRNMCTAGLTYLFVYALTYSFTGEYNKTVLMRNSPDVYIKNGLITTTDKYDKIFYTDSKQKDGDNFTELWKEECSRNFQLSKVDKFLQKYPAALNTTEKFFLYQNIKMKKVHYKIRQYLPLAAIGTISDSMMITEDNRILVSEGLCILNGDKSGLTSGLRELVKVLDLTGSNINEVDLGFSLGPVINAAGRMGHAKLALDTLIGKDPIDGARYAFLLKEENEKRKSLSRDSVRLLEESIQTQPHHCVVVGYHENIHRGISGIVASKLAEKYEKPALVLVNDGEYLRGSVRSYQNENVLGIITELAAWFVQYGGHIQAAGFSLEYKKREEFIKEFIRKSSELLGDKINVPGDALNFPLIEIKDSDLYPSLWKELLIFAPYGNGNPRPRLLIEPTSEISYKFMGKDKNHARVNLSGIKNGMIEAVWFNFGKEIENFRDYKSVKILAEPQVNFFRGTEKYQLRIISVTL